MLVIALIVIAMCVISRGCRTRYSSETQRKQKALNYLIDDYYANDGLTEESKRGWAMLVGEEVE